LGKNAQISGNLESGFSIEAPTVRARTMMSTPLLNVSSQIDSKLVQTSNLHVFYEAQVGGNVHVSKNILVTGSLQVDQFISTSSLDVKQSMNASSANITGHLTASSINVSSVSVSSQFEVVGTQAKPVQSVNGYESSNGGIEVAKNIISHGMLAAKLGVSTSNLTAHGKVTFEGNDTFIQKLQVQEVVVAGGNNSLSGIWLNDGANLTINAPGFLHSRGGLIVDNGTVSEFRGDALVTGKFEFSETLKVAGTLNSESIFTSRIYTEDLSARGFVSASTVVSTGDVEVSKSVNVRASVIAEERVEAAHIVSRNSITAPSASLDRISAAAVTVQKLMVSTELMVQDINVMQLIEKEFKLLKDRIDALERQLSSYIEL
jgi:cytoskeletal protein CcmA (bactofilin family)